MSQLDDLKKLWAQQPETQKHSAYDLEAMLRRKSTNVLGRINRSIRKDAIGGLVGLLVLGIIYPYCTSAFDRLFVLSMGGAMVVVLVLLYLKYKALKNYYSRANLRQGVRLMIQLLKRSVMAYFIFFWVAVVAGGFLGFFSSELGDEGDSFLADIYGGSIHPGWIIAGGLIFIGLYYLLFRWLVHKLYGRHIKTLEDILKEFQEQEADHNGSNGSHAEAA